MNNIKVISKELNISSRTLRYYEEIGLIESQRINNQRFYEENELEKLNLIVLLRKIDLSLEDIKKLLKDYNKENFNKLINDKINYYYHNITLNSKKLYILTQIQNKVKEDKEIDDLILNETTKILNQDKLQEEKVEEFLNLMKEDNIEGLRNILDSRMDIEILKNVFIKDLKLNETDHSYKIYNHLSYYNNIILLKLIIEKTYIIRFVFNADNLIAGIWLDKSY